ncbi:hypothetical protein [Armatimonas sp.]|uniref:hypothetical protein n=1 Tax=Armatimonas sp. TaxID=1872638 RepID=UPI00286A60B3|nr:hypothetical protein [Armatimonas sp.]
MTLTIDALPEEVVALTATPEGMARARMAVLHAFGIVPQENSPEVVEAEGEALEELLAALKESDDDIATGRTLTCEQESDRLEAKFPWLKAHQQTKRTVATPRTS